MSDDTSNTDTTNQTGGSSTLTLALVLGSVVLGVLFYIVVRYASPVIRNWRARLNGNTTAHAPTLGLRPSDIEAFPTFIYRGAIQNRRGSTDHGNTNGKCNGNRLANGKGHGISVDCNICLCDLEEDDVVRMLPVCRHFFHIQCIDVWLYSHPSCPICRAKMQIESAALTECSMSPPLPQFCRYCNLQGSGQTNIPETTEEVTTVPRIGEITEIVVDKECEMETSSVDSINRSLCNNSPEVRIDINDEVDIESYPIENYGRSISSKEEKWVYHIGSPSQKVPMDEAMSEPENQEMLENTSIKGSPEVQVEVEKGCASATSGKSLTT